MSIMSKVMLTLCSHYAHSSISGHSRDHIREKQKRFSFHTQSTITPHRPPVHPPVHLFRNSVRRASRQPRDQSTQPSQSHTPSTSPHPLLPAYTGKPPRCPVKEPRPSAPLSPPPCSTLCRSAGHPAGPLAGPYALW